MYADAEEDVTKKAEAFFKLDTLTRVMFENLVKCDYGGYRFDNPNEVLTVLKSLEPKRFKAKIKEIEGIKPPKKTPYEDAFKIAEKEFQEEN